MSVLRDDRTIDQGPAGPVQFGSGAMFDRIARRYDLLNRLLSVGVDRRWRRLQVRSLRLPPAARVLDIATGTGDVALEVARQHPDARTLGLDPSLRMLSVGREKVRRAERSKQIDLLFGDARDLPYTDRSFDGVTIAFGIRNVPDRARALAEMARVTRPAGRVAILELLEPQGGGLSPLVRWWVRSVVPALGALLSGASEYRYLQRSMAAFPEPEAFSREMREAGLDVLEVRPLTCGVVCLFVARPSAGAGS